MYTVPEVQAGMQIYLGKNVQQVSTSDIRLDKADYECLLKIVESEAGICDRKGKILVANVVLNRMNSCSFPDTVTEVVYQKNQFSPVKNGSIDQVTVSGETREAVSLALSGTDYSQGALFFVARKLADEENMEWFDSSLKYLFEHDGHEFYTLK
ncbi:MAG: cell wall hydrolase [Lachnospiraceae bacterium]|nr:cell wall hydrolase [Lachnospiraceae bacterium]